MVNASWRRRASQGRGEMLLIIKSLPLHPNFLFIIYHFLFIWSQSFIINHLSLFMKPARYLVTAALPYANGPKHIGHLAGAYIPADVYVRYQRLRKRDILFVCGSDEHGTAIPNQALKENPTPQAIIDKYHALIKDCFLKLGMSFDIYHRTSDPLHHQTAQEFFLTLYEKGLLQEETSEQYFDEKANVFLADRYITGICPKCNYDHA